MFRGDISNRPAAIIAVDYRILLEEKRGYSWFIKAVPELLLKKGFESKMKKALPWKPGAKLWLETYWEKRFAVFTVNVPIISRAIDMIVGDIIAETYHFHDRYEFRRWTQINQAIGRVYTNDPLLLGLDGLTQTHSGWSEEV